MNQKCENCEYWREIGDKVGHCCILPAYTDYYYWCEEYERRTSL